MRTDRRNRPGRALPRLAAAGRQRTRGGRRGPGRSARTGSGPATVADRRSPGGGRRRGQAGGDSPTGGAGVAGGQAAPGRRGDRQRFPADGGRRRHQRFAGAEGRCGRGGNGRRRRRHRPGLGGYRADRQRPAPPRHLRAAQPAMPADPAGQRGDRPRLDPGDRRRGSLRPARRGRGDGRGAAAQPQHLAGAGQCRTPAAFRGALGQPRPAVEGREEEGTP